VFLPLSAAPQGQLPFFDRAVHWSRPSSSCSNRLGRVHRLFFCPFPLLRPWHVGLALPILAYCFPPQVSSRTVGLHWILFPKLLPPSLSYVSSSPRLWVRESGVLRGRPRKSSLFSSSRMRPFSLLLSFLGQSPFSLVCEVIVLGTLERRSLYLL